MLPHQRQLIRDAQRCFDNMVPGFIRHAMVGHSKRVYLRRFVLAFLFTMGYKSEDLLDMAADLERCEALLKEIAVPEAENAFNGICDFERLAFFSGLDGPVLRH